MNVLTKPVNLFYSFILLFIILVPVNSGFFIKFLACVFLLLIWFFYLLGSKLSFKVRTNATLQSECFFKKRRYALLLILIQTFASIYAGQFYTGLSFLEALNNLMLGDSNYSLYQQYFMDSGLKSFSPDKILPILSNFFVKFIFIYILYFYLVHRNKRIDFCIVFLSALPMIIMSAFRGTNFELFEVFVALICAFYIKSKLTGGVFPLLKLLLFGAFLIFIYVIQILLRYKFEYNISCNNEFCYNYSSILHSVFPPIASTFYKLSGYFYFAPDYMARWFIYFIDENLLLTTILPGSDLLYHYEGKWLCIDNLRCGPTWAPDFEIYVYIFGLPATYFMITIFSSFQHLLARTAFINFIDFLGFYLITLQFFAFPVGNFLFVSSANKLLMILFIALYLLRFLSKKRAAT